jgi:hypothetical protein
MDMYDRAMDIENRVAAWGTAYARTCPDITNNAIKFASWAATLNPYIQLAFHLAEAHSDIPEDLNKGWEHVHEGLEAAGEYAEQEEAAEYAETVKEGLTGPDRSVEIGGPTVDAQIAEIMKLQDRHEKQRADQAVQTAERRDQLVEKFDGAAKAAQDALAAQQAAELEKLQEQQLQQQSIQEQPQISNPSDPDRDR